MLLLSHRLDGPLWMVGHNVSPQGVILNPAIGSLDKEAPVPTSTAIRRRFANEPKMDMWLMYACPYIPNGRIYNCDARAADAHESGTTFLANERTLTREAGMTQVGGCSRSRARKPSSSKWQTQHCGSSSGGPHAAISAACSRTVLIAVLANRLLLHMSATTTQQSAHTTAPQHHST
jgi:hypothetical protein